MRILHNLKSGNWQSLKNKYCIVSFNPNNVAVHERYIDPCLAGRSRVLGYEKETFVVNYPKDVLKMPRCKVMLVFVDNNCDDIILERPGKETGDLRLLTVKACQKMNGKIYAYGCYAVRFSKQKSIFFNSITSNKNTFCCHIHVIVLCCLCCYLP